MRRIVPLISLAAGLAGAETAKPPVGPQIPPGEGGPNRPEGEAG